MNDASGHSKQEIEVEFPVKGSKTSPLWFSRLWVEALNCFLVDMNIDQKCKNMKWMQ